MMADLTWAVDQMLKLKVYDLEATGEFGGCQQNDNIVSNNPFSATPTYIYGETGSSSTAVLTEDQSGAESIVSYTHVGPTHQQPTLQQQECGPRRNEWTKDGTTSGSLWNSVHWEHGACPNTGQTRKETCRKRLLVASKLVRRIQYHIYAKTQFLTTIGISTSPQLCKIATGLQKPRSINILFPWRSVHFMDSMPLRKLHGVGYRTIKALDSALELYYDGRNDSTRSDQATKQPEPNSHNTSNSIGNSTLKRPEFWTVR